LTEAQLSEFGITRDQIDLVVAYQFDFVSEFFENPIKGKLYIHELGSFVIHAKTVIGFLKSIISRLKKKRANNEPYDINEVNRFKHWWKYRHVAIEYVANYSRQNVKGFYRPFDIKKNIYIPKSKKGQ